MASFFSKDKTVPPDQSKRPSQNATTSTSSAQQARNQRLPTYTESLKGNTSIPGSARGHQGFNAPYKPAFTGAPALDPSGGLPLNPFQDPQSSYSSLYPEDRERKDRRHHDTRSRARTPMDNQPSGLLMKDIKELPLAYVENMIITLASLSDECPRANIGVVVFPGRNDKKVGFVAHANGYRKKPNQAGYGLSYGSTNNRPWYDRDTASIYTGDIGASVEEATLLLLVRATEEMASKSCSKSMGKGDIEEAW